MTSPSAVGEGGVEVGVNTLDIGVSGTETGVAEQETLNPSAKNKVNSIILKPITLINPPST